MLMATKPQEVTIVPQDQNDKVNPVNPATGTNVNDVYPGSFEQMPLVDRFTGGATFEGDMGRLVR